VRRDGLDAVVTEKMHEGRANANRYGSVLTDDAIRRLDQIVPMGRARLEAESAVGSLYAWAIPLSRPSVARLE
jgi:hypothetical protein